MINIPRIAFIPGLKIPETSVRICLLGIGLQNGNILLFHLKYSLFSTFFSPII
jgi:hypothetical protein